MAESIPGQKPGPNRLLNRRPDAAGRTGALVGRVYWGNSLEYKETVRSRSEKTFLGLVSRCDDRLDDVVEHKEFRALADRYNEKTYELRD